MLVCDLVRTLAVMGCVTLLTTLRGVSAIRALIAVSGGALLIGMLFE